MRAPPPTAAPSTAPSASAAAPTSCANACPGCRCASPSASRLPRVGEAARLSIPLHDTPIDTRDGTHRLHEAGTVPAGTVGQVLEGPAIATVR